MTMAMPPLRMPPEVVAPRVKIRIRRRPAAVLRRLLSELTALPDRDPTLDGLPPEFFRFPAF